MIGIDSPRLLLPLEAPEAKFDKRPDSPPSALMDGNPKFKTAQGAETLSNC